MQMKIRSDVAAFTPDQLAVCGTCGRGNAPDRPNCLYCGSELESSPESQFRIKSTHRELEAWERGFNVIIRPVSGGINADVDAVSRSTGLPADIAAAVIAAARPMPVARVASELDALQIVAALEQLGINATVISDELLDPARPPVRLRAIEFGADSITLVDFNRGVRKQITQNNIALLVIGVISERRTERLEKRKRGGEPKTLEQVESESDEPILDLYDRSDTIGFRVMSTGFDFSCLGTDKGYIAGSNMRQLAERLQQFAPNARVTDLLPLRRTISAVWAPETQKQSLGLQRSLFGRSAVGKRVLSNNVDQMNRFSRLERHLL